MDLSVVLACYNDSKYLYNNFIELVNTLDLMKINYEIILVDDKSKDNTSMIIRKIKNKFKKQYNLKCIFHSVNTGRGKAVRDGFHIATGEIIGFLDVDLEVHARYILSAIQSIRKGYDVSTAYRIYKLSLSFRILLRHVMSHSYRYLSRLILRHNFKDTETGFKFFNRKRITPLLQKCKYDGWFWDTEIMILSLIEKLKVREVPCLFIRMKGKKSKTKVFQDTIGYIINLFRFRKEMRKRLIY